MINSQAATSEPIHARIARLHGLGSVALTPFSADTCGLHEATPAPLSPRLASFIREILEFAGSVQHPVGSEEFRHDQARALDGIQSRLNDEVSNWDQPAFRAFDRIMAVEALKALVSRFEAIPPFDVVEGSEDPLNGFRQVHLLYSEAISILGMLDRISHGYPLELPTLRALNENLDHDMLGHFSMFLNAIPGPGTVDLRQDVRADYNFERAFILQVLGGNLAIVSGEMRPRKALIHDVLEPAIRLNALRFGYTDEPGNDIERIRAPGLIVVDIPASLELYLDPDALALVVYNLVKNPLKMGRELRLEKPSLLISAALAPDGETASIFIRDNAIGLSYDKWRQHFSLQALHKRGLGVPLNEIEECLLDEDWREHVPPVALATLIMNRGESGGSGTGIGLDLAKQIIEGGHQGAFRLYDHPEYGAGVQILLPTDLAAAPAARRAAIERQRQAQLSKLAHSS